MKAAFISPTVFPLLSSTCQNSLLGKRTLVTEIRILSAVSTVYGMPVSSILKRNDKKRVNTEPRQMAMLFMRLYTDLLVREIGGMFDKPYDHTTVIHSCETIQNDMETDETILERYRRVEEALFNEKTIGGSKDI